MIKSGQTLNRDFFTGIERWTALAGELAATPALVYGGIGRLLHRGVDVHGWDAAGQVLWKGNPLPDLSADVQIPGAH